MMTRFERCRSRVDDDAVEDGIMKREVGRR
jgi:hypothetical protein